MKKLLVLFSMVVLGFHSEAQTVLTMDVALDIASSNSPEMQTSLLNLERYKLNVLAQRASLRSQFSLNLNAADRSEERRVGKECRL